MFRSCEHASVELRNLPTQEGVFDVHTMGCLFREVTQGTEVAVIRGTRLYRLQYVQLLDFELEAHDLVVVGPHGDMVLPVSLAIQQGIIPSEDARFMHIDGHYDNLDSSVGHCDSPFADKEFHACATQQALEQFLTAKDREQKVAAYQFLMQVCRGDISTFISALSNHFLSISAVIVESGQTESVHVGPLPFADYMGKVEHIPRRDDCTLGQLIAEHQPHVFSIDGDVTGIFEEFENLSKEFQKFRIVMDYLLRELSVLHSKEDSDTSRLFTVSLDRNYNAQPYNFMAQFLTKFYLPYVKLRRESLHLLTTQELATDTISSMQA